MGYKELERRIKSKAKKCKTAPLAIRGIVGYYFGRAKWKYARSRDPKTPQSQKKRLYAVAVNELLNAQVVLDAHSSESLAKSWEGSFPS